MARSRSSRPRRKATRPANNFTAPANDFLSRTFEGSNLVPAGLAGTDLFLDIVTWNIRYFHDQDPERVDRIARILAALNADVFVLEEIKDESLEPVVQALEQLGAGHYSVAYGTTGGQQRVALMWDLDWIRAKDDVHELFSRGAVMSPDGKDAFPRLPLWGYFTGLREEPDADPFDFQLLGLHLKSQRGGGQLQRITASEKLASWLRIEAIAQDADVIMIGDWNEKPNSPSFEAFHRLEERNEAYFSKINNSSDISHFYYKNKSELGSRLDLAAVSVSAYENMANRNDGAVVVRWEGLDSFLSRHPSAQDIKRLLADIGTKVSDHMPVVTRFYWTVRPQA